MLLVTDVFEVLSDQLEYLSTESRHNRVNRPQSLVDLSTDIVSTVNCIIAWDEHKDGLPKAIAKERARREASDRAETEEQQEENDGSGP